MAITLGNASPVVLSDPALWSKFQSASSKGKVGLFKIILPVRSAEELFSNTARQESISNKFKVVINGPTYGLTAAGKADALFGSDPVKAEETLQEGRIVRNKRVIGGSRSDMYYIANYTGKAVKYRFGRGAAPTDADAALGNMGPLIINGLPFGKVNKYDPPQPDAIRKGQPAPKYANSLVQRSNNRFTVMAGEPNPVGKIALGFRQDKGLLLVLVQPHATPGINIAGFKGVMQHLGLNSAVYLDGSDSVMLMMDSNMLISQGSNKNETNVTGIGFVY
ncbi:MAG: phosphodiester glycosidase family protein [Candidatus Thiodiazotropha sp.]